MKSIEIKVRLAFCLLHFYSFTEVWLTYINRMSLKYTTWCHYIYTPTNLPHKTMNLSLKTSLSFPTPEMTENSRKYKVIHSNFRSRG
jgi:hypothetical protein